MEASDSRPFCQINELPGQGISYCGYLATFDMWFKRGENMTKLHICDTHVEVAENDSDWYDSKLMECVRAELH